MKRSLALLFGTLAFCGLGGSASAENPIKNLLDTGATKTEASAAACDEGCRKSYFFAEAEATWFRYHRADGLRVGTGGAADDDITDNDFEFSPRLTVGYLFDGGIGARLRWWDFDHSQTAVNPDGTLAVDTFTVDLELFDRFQLNSCWAIEVSAGIRYNEFNETMNDGGDLRINDFDGYGGIFGIEAQRSLGSGALYARARVAILMGDKFRTNTGSGDETYRDSVQGMVELAMGYQFNWELQGGSLLFGRIGAEWQNWYNYSSVFDTGTDEATWDGQSDVGFGGLTFAIGLRY